MDDESTTPGADPVSFTKRGADLAPAPKRPGLLGRAGRANLAADGSAMPSPPKYVRYAAIALVLSALMSIISAASLFGNKDWLLDSYKKNNPAVGKKNHRSLSTLQHAANTAPNASLLAGIVLALALLFATRGVLRGRYWARWTVLALWVLATLTGTFASFTYLIAVASDEPLSLKAPSFICAASLIVAVGFVSLKPSVQYFTLTRPPRPDGAAPARRGLFGPRPGRPAAAASAPRPERTSNAAAAAERSRSKQRTSESVAKGAELARARAKASKSRRNGG